MHSPGKVQTLYDLKYYHQEHEGVDFSIYSLTELAKLKPALLCPYCVLRIGGRRLILCRAWKS